MTFAIRKLEGKNFLFLVFLLLFLGCAGPKQEIKPTEQAQPSSKEDTEDFAEGVEAEGVVAVIKGNLLATKDQALMAAQRAALEKAVGVYITGQTIVQNAAVIEENIFSRTVGYIRDFKILSETEDGEFYKTKIFAKIKLSDVKKDLDGLGLLIKTKKVGNPRVMVLIDEEIDGVPSTAGNAETALINQLLDKGYKVVDREQTKNIRADERAKLTSAGSDKEIALIGSKFEADVIIAGKIISKFNTDQDLAGLISYRSSINAKVVKAATGEVILTSSRTGSGVDITKEMAAGNSITKIAKSLGDELVPQIATKLYEGANVVVTVAGIQTINKLEEFNKILRGFDGVSATYVRSYEKEEAKIELDLKYGNAQTIASKLEALSNWKITVREVGGYSIKAEIVK